MQRWYWKEKLDASHSSGLKCSGSPLEETINYELIIFVRWKYWGAWQILTGCQFCCCGFFVCVCVCYISSRDCRWKWRMCKWNLKLKSMKNSDWSFWFFICWFFLLLLLFFEFILSGNCMHRRRRIELYRILPLVLSRNDFRFWRTSRVSNPVSTDFVWLIP